MKMSKPLKKEMNEDLEDARYNDRKRWYVRNIKPDGKNNWKYGFVDKYNQPLYDSDGQYIPRQRRIKNRNEREIYYRNNPHKSLWKTNLYKNQRK